MTPSEKVELFQNLAKDFPEVDKIVLDALTEDEFFYFIHKNIDTSKNEIKEVLALPFFEEPTTPYCKLAMRYDKGILKCGMELIFPEEEEYLRIHMPVINYIPRFYPYDEYGKTWSCDKNDLKVEE